MNAAAVLEPVLSAERARKHAETALLYIPDNRLYEVTEYLNRIADEGFGKIEHPELTFDDLKPDVQQYLRDAAAGKVEMYGPYDTPAAMWADMDTRRARGEFDD